MEGQSRYDRTRRVIANVMKMFERRGYSMGAAKEKYEQIISSNAEMKEVYDENTYFVILQAMERRGAEEILHYAFIVRESEKLKKHIMEQIFAILKKDESERQLNAIVIANRAGQKKQKVTENFEFHFYDEFLYDIYDHVLGATYTRVHDTALFAKTFKMKKLSELSRIPPTDRFALYLGLKEGDVVKVETMNEVSGISDAYKIVM